MRKKLKIATVVGTRPEIIRLSRVIAALEKYTDHILINTMQNFSKNLNDNFFKELGIKKPDYTLNVQSETIGGQMGNILSQVETVFHKEKPDALLVLGDTNSGLSSITAKRMKIPIFHMEAGNRSFDENVPEETNRRIIDHISDRNLPYTENSRQYLLREGIHPKNIYVTGSPLAEVLSFYKNKMNTSKALTKLKLQKKKFFLVSLHREENVDNEKILRTTVSSLEALSKKFGFPVIVSTHPRTQKRLKESHLTSTKIRFLEPFGFFDYCFLQKNAFCVISDSGSIQEESAILGFPAIQPRVSTERPEAFDTGSIVVCGHEENAMLDAVELVAEEYHKEKKSLQLPDDYRSQNVSSKVVRLIIGQTHILLQKRNHVHSHEERM